MGKKGNIQFECKIFFWAKSKKTAIAHLNQAEKEFNQFWVKPSLKESNPKPKKPKKYLNKPSSNTKRGR